VFLGITIILTDGMFNFFTIITTSMLDLYNKRQEQDSGSTHYITKHPSLSYDDRKRIEKLVSDQVPHQLPVIGYIICVTISAVVIPSIFHQIKFYHVVALYIIAPVFSFCNTYGVGLTDWSAAPTYAKFTIFFIAAWIGQPGAVVAGLVACGIMNSATHISSQSMQDFKTGYMTLTSPQAMLTGQVFGIILGAITNPCIFYAFKETVKNSIDIGGQQSEFPCPYAGVYRAIGIIGMGGVKELPKHCVAFCTVAFFITLSIDILKLVSQKKGWALQNYAPSMTAVALPFFAGPSVPIPMCVGSLLLYMWNKVDGQSAELLSSAVAAGMISGEGLFALPTALLTMKKVQPPICMKFLPSGEELGEVDSFLSTLASSNS
jgi:OPT family oligopeptide transporter